jgi:hypothetical protein
VISAGDIGGAADQFHYVYQPLQGDGEIIAQVAARAGLDGWSQAGVMIRQSLTPTASEVFIGATGGNGWVVHRRDLSTAGSTETTFGPPGGAPGWVRLIREGDRISAFQSADGTSWTLVSATTSPMPWTAYVGLAVSSHRETYATGLFTDVTVRAITGGGVTPTPPTAPTVSIASPLDGAVIPANQPITVTASANAPNGVGSVVFLVNGAQAGTDTTAPYSVTLSSLAPGTYRFSAVAIDGSGVSSNPAMVTVTVLEPATSSPLSITSPLGGATFTAPATITIVARPNTDGAISRVDFYGDGTLIGSSTTSPYSLTWNYVGAGIHLLTATATLSAGTSITSPAVPVSVGAARPEPATLMFTPSAGDSTSVTYYTLEVYAAGGAMPVASRYLGTPAVANGEISVDVSDLVAALSPGTYVAVVTAYGPGGSTPSQPSPTFVK